MCNFLKNETEENNQEFWISELKEAKERWFSFLEKMEAEMEELCTAAIAELSEATADNDIYKRTFYKIQSDINRQLGNIRKKVYETYEGKINDLYYNLRHEISVLHPEYSIIVNFRAICLERYHQQFEDKYQYWRYELEKIGPAK